MGLVGSQPEAHALCGSDDISLPHPGFQYHLIHEVLSFLAYDSF